MGKCDIFKIIIRQFSSGYFIHPASNFEKFFSEYSCVNYIIAFVVSEMGFVLKIFWVWEMGEMIIEREKNLKIICVRKQRSINPELNSWILYQVGTSKTKKFLKVHGLCCTVSWGQTINSRCVFGQSYPCW